MLHVLPSGMTVLEILECLEPTPDLIEACRKLKAEGFRLALDDFTWKPKFDPLVEMADYVKVDFLQTNASMRQSLLERLSGVTVALVAEKIETQEEYKQACAEGFTLFQGYYFCRPALIENRKIPANRISHIEILQHLRGDVIDLHKLTMLLKRDASLTYRLLRLVNSPMCAMRQEVRSIQAALLAVGEDAFRRIATLAIASELNSGQPAEILRMAFMRGRSGRRVVRAGPHRTVPAGIAEFAAGHVAPPHGRTGPGAAAARGNSRGAPGQGQFRAHPAPMAGEPRVRRLGRLRCDSPCQWPGPGVSGCVLCRSRGVGGRGGSVRELKHLSRWYRVHLCVNRHCQ
jgi:EAL and modified HD-GYP domain-containing signal transduction protein